LRLRLGGNNAPQLPAPASRHLRRALSDEYFIEKKRGRCCADTCDGFVTSVIFSAFRRPSVTGSPAQ
jgi:hypothetical protein